MLNAVTRRELLHMLSFIGVVPVGQRIFVLKLSPSGCVGAAGRSLMAGLIEAAERGDKHVSAPAAVDKEPR